MPAVTRGVHVTAPWASTPGNLDGVLATPGLNLIEIDVKDENGEVSGLGPDTPALARRYGAAARLLRPRARRAARARPPHLGRRAHRQLQGPDRRRARQGARDPRRARAASGTTAAASPGSTSTARSAWAYLISLGKAAARAGVDEVQYDYVRFPSEGDLSVDALAAQEWPSPRTRRSRASSRRRAARSSRSTSSSASTSSASPPRTSSASGRTSP